MLTLTDAAADAIKSMLASGNLPPGSGLRVSAELDEHAAPTLHLSFTVEPEDGDEVVTHQGARVFLDPAASDALEDRTLDAETHEDHAHFTLLDE
jgi:Fe-S cluster assembly iron-binding protein IscA